MAIKRICISKSELSDWESQFISEEAAVLTPFCVILVTIATFPSDTRIFPAACTFLAIRRCASPVSHIFGITGYPPPIRINGIKQQHWVKTLVLDKLFTMWGDFSETAQLRQTCSGVMNVSWVTPSRITPIHQCSVLAVMTNDCHANSVLVSHVTGHVKW